MIMPIQPEPFPSSHGPVTAAEIVDDQERRRFEISSSDQLAGYAEYRDLPHGRAFVHTVIDPQRAGLGLGSRLIESVLDEARAEGRNVIPLCPFVRRYIQRHPSYADLVADQKRFGLYLKSDGEQPAQS
jgi:hypothetical protein